MFLARGRICLTWRFCRLLLRGCVPGNMVPIGSAGGGGGIINNACGEAHKCKLEFSSVVFVLNHLDETVLKALSFSVAFGVSP